MARTVSIERDGDGWVVTTLYEGGRWDGFECIHYSKRYREARREYDRMVLTRAG